MTCVFLPGISSYLQWSIFPPIWNNLEGCIEQKVIEIEERDSQGNLFLIFVECSDIQTLVGIQAHLEYPEKFC